MSAKGTFGHGRRLLFLSICAVTLAVGLTSGATRPAQAGFPGLNGKIAFRSDRDGNREIYVMNADGTNQVDISNNPASDAEPAWSPDGNWIAFSSNRDGNSEIYKMRADGTEQTRLTFIDFEDRYPAWTSDGRIAFERDATGGSCSNSSEIFVMNADGTAEHNLTNNISDADCSPAGASSGKIAFFSNRAGGQTQIYSFDADGACCTRLTNNAWCDLYPNWSPYADRIVFVRDLSANCDSDNDMYVIQADGSNELRLTDTPNRVEFFGAWSPQGDSLAFDGCPTSPSGPCQIYTMSSSGGGEHQLTSVGDNSHPDWQPLPLPPPPPPPPAPPPPPPPAVRCHVPRVIGLTLARARAKIRSKHCSVGRIRRAHSRRVGRVISQKPRPGSIRARGFPVRLVVGRR